MFCKFCGKQIVENSKFCQYCGNSLCGTESYNSSLKDYSANGSKRTVKKSEANRLFILLTTTLLILSFIVRLTTQELTTIRHLFAMDDYYAITDTGRIWITIFMTMQVLGLFFFRVFGISKDKPLKVSAYILLAFALIIETLLILIKFPAPY